MNIYRLDDRLRQLQDLDRHKNQCIDTKHAVRGIYMYFVSKAI